MADPNPHIEAAKKEMQKAVAHFSNELTKIRAGKATPQLLDGIQVDYYGVKSPINQVATINNLDAKTLVIKPWEKSMVEEIEKAIHAANIGITPQNDGEVLRLSLPPLTEERRKELVKKISDLAENARIMIRNNRRSANEAVKSLEKEGLSEDEIKVAAQEIQKLTDDFTGKVDQYMQAKEADLMKV